MPDLNWFGLDARGLRHHAFEQYCSSFANGPVARQKRGVRTVGSFWDRAPRPTTSNKPLPSRRVDRLGCHAETYRVIAWDRFEELRKHGAARPRSHSVSRFEPAGRQQNHKGAEALVEGEVLMPAENTHAPVYRIRPTKRTGRFERRSPR